MKKFLAILLFLSTPVFAQTDRASIYIATERIVIGGSTFGTTSPLQVIGLPTLAGTILTVDGSGNIGKSGNATVSGTLTSTSGLNSFSAVQFAGTTGIPASVGASGAVIVNGGGSPVSSRLIVGDGSGWELLISSRTGSSTTDWLSIQDTGTIRPVVNYSGNLGQYSRKFLSLHAAELVVSSLVAQQVLASIGGRVMVGNTTQLANTLAPGDPAVYFKHNSFSNGDFLVLESNGQFEVIQLTSGCYAPCSSAPYIYNVSHNIDGTGSNTWQAGDAVFSIQSNWIDIYSVSGLNASTAYGPTMVGQVRNSSTWNDWSPRWGVGRLDQIYGYTSTSCGGAPCYGAGFGKWESNVVTIDPSNGIRFLYNGTVLGQIQNSTITLGQPLTANNTGQFYVDSSTIKLKWRDNVGVTKDLLLVSNVSGAGFVAFDSDVSVLGAGGVTASQLVYSSGDLTIRQSGLTQSIVFAVAGTGAVKPSADATKSLGASGARWGKFFLGPTTTVATFNPLVLGTNGEVWEKTDGISATFNPTTCTSMTYEAGILTAKAGC